MKSLCTNPLHSGDRVHKNNRIRNILTEHFICAECRTNTTMVQCVYRSYYKYARLYKHHFYFSPSVPPVPYTIYNSIDAHIAGELYILNPFKRLKATARWWRRRRWQPLRTHVYIIDNGRIQYVYAYYNGLVPIYHI